MFGADPVKKIKLDYFISLNANYCQMEQTPLDKALNLAGTYYRGENYGKALDLFRRCLSLAKSYPEQELIRLRNQMGLPKHNSPRSHTVYHPKYSILLESLCACYEKLADFGKALEYTHRLIKVEPFNVKAYLRLQRLLQRQGKLDSALAACKRGINNSIKFQQNYGVPISQKHLEQLRKTKKCIAEKLVPVDRAEKRHILQPEKQESSSKKPRHVKSTFDIISRLPLELHALILDGFSSKELIEVALVCKRWHQYVFGQPQLFQRFLLSNSTYRQVNKFVDFAGKIRRRHSSIELIKYSSRFPADEPRSLEVLFSKLRGYRCRRVLLSVPHCTTAHLSRYMGQNVGLCQNLQELSLVVSLRADKPQSEIDMLSNCHNLKRLEIVVNKSVVSLTDSSSRLDRSSSFIETNLIPTWAAKLESLSICCDLSRVDRFPFATLVSHFPANCLKRLCITGVTFTQLTNQFDWLANFRHLKELWFEDNKGASLSTLLKLLKDYPLSDKLEKLTFREFLTTTKLDLESPAESFFYAHNFQNLRALDLMGSSISGLGLLRLVSYTQPSKLHILNIGDCPHIRLGRHQYLNDTSYLSTSAFFMRVPELRELVMPQFGALDENTVKLLVEEAPNWYYIRKLDLSMNPSITGVSVYELLKALWETRNAPLEVLIIDGCPSISHITVNMIRAQRLAKQVDCQYERDTWRKVGINSLKYRAVK